MVGAAEGTGTEGPANFSAGGNSNAGQGRVDRSANGGDLGDVEMYGISGGSVPPTLPEPTFIYNHLSQNLTINSMSPDILAYGIYGPKGGLRHAML